MEYQEYKKKYENMKIKYRKLENTIFILNKIFTVNILSTKLNIPQNVLPNIFPKIIFSNPIGEVKIIGIVPIHFSLSMSLADEKQILPQNVDIPAPIKP